MYYTVQYMNIFNLTFTIFVGGPKLFRVGTWLDGPTILARYSNVRKLHICRIPITAVPTKCLNNFTSIIVNDYHGAVSM